MAGRDSVGQRSDPCEHDRSSVPALTEHRPTAEAAVRDSTASARAAADARATCWTMVHEAAQDDAVARETFGRTYLPVVQRYLSQRWRSSPLRQEIDDAVQEVFVDLMADGGALSRVDPSRPGGFRAFLWGVSRHVALRVETRRARRHGREALGAIDADDVPSPDDGPSRLFDREWARGVMRAAAARQERTASLAGSEAVRRCELLRLRFHEGLPIRDIAAAWAVDADGLHRSYARARREFRDALRAEVAFHHSGTPADVDRECARLVQLLR